MELDALLALAQANLPAIAVALACVVVVLVLLRSGGGKSAPAFLDPQEFKPLTLARIDQITHNTKRFVFDLPSKKMRLGLPTGQHITFLAQDADGKDVYRPYTPTTDDDTLGSVEFVIKLYPNGKMSQVLDKMRVGDAMLMKGPRGRFAYTSNMKRAIGMLAGGSGITPMFQVAQAILKDPRDTTQLVLLFGNLTEQDILLREELEQMAAANPGRFTVHHVLNTPPRGWKGHSGFITRDLLGAHLPPPCEDVLVLRCGPGPMNDAMKGHLDALGYEEACQFQF